MRCGRRSWKTIQLPEDLLKVVDKIVSRPELGYTSRSEFVKEAVRLRIEAVQRNLQKKLKNSEEKE